VTPPGQALNPPERAALGGEVLRLLQKYNRKIAAVPLSQLLARPGRFEAFSRAADGVLLDFSRVHLDDEGLGLLVGLAERSGLQEAIVRLFRAREVNVTEGRPAMHMALRTRELGKYLPAQEVAAMEEAMGRMLSMADALHRGELPDAGGRVRHLLHVGIGGSLLGTQLLCEALGAGRGQGPEVHFLGSVDAHFRESLLPRLDPAETAVVLVSKSFSTPDTLMHGERIRQWLWDGLGGQAAAGRLFAVTAARARAAGFGVPAEQVLHLPEWVGGRYSLWSPVSLSAAAQAGPDAFRELLSGAETMDRHFLAAEPRDNLPVLMGLLGVWHRNVCGYPCWGVIPYDQRLRLLPAHLQQLVMESTGKSVSLEGERLEHATAPVVFGECGTDAQHSLFQAMHQGTDRVPLNLVGVIRPHHGDRAAHAELLANMLAQATALATGRGSEQTRSELEAGGIEVSDAMLAHRSFEGDRPTEILLLDDLSPANLGKLLALYEQKVYVESVIWRVNAFDQWGVELGKSLAPGIRGALESGAESGQPGLEGLLGYIRARERNPG